MSTSKENVLDTLKSKNKNKKPTAAEKFAEEMNTEEEKAENTQEQSNSEHTSVNEGKKQTFIDIFKEEKEKKKTVEDTHTRSTFLIRNDLLSRMDKLAKKRKRGFKTDFVNYAIEQLLNEIEDEK